MLFVNLLKIRAAEPMWQILVLKYSWKPRKTLREEKKCHLEFAGSASLEY